MYIIIAISYMYKTIKMYETTCLRLVYNMSNVELPKIYS